MRRPDLNAVEPEIIAYIEHLEAELARQQETTKLAAREDKPPEPAEPPTTVSLVTLSRIGIAKRTFRHLYPRQHHGGMGVFDLDLPSTDKPVFLSLLEENQNLLVFTNTARGFLVPLCRQPVVDIHSRGESILEKVALEKEERIAAILPAMGSGYVILVSEHGMIRSLRHHLFGEYLKPGTAFYNHREFGDLATACWSPGNHDIFIATHKGIGIRFSEKLIPPQGAHGMRVDDSDRVVAVTPVNDQSGVFLAGADGKGTVRLMSGFLANKSAGGGGKTAMKTDHLVGAVSVENGDDLFMISETSKIIRFQAEEVPPTEGVVQGVNCMSLRADHVTAILKSSRPGLFMKPL